LESDKFFSYFVRVNIVSELLLFNANSSIFQLSYGEIKLIFNEMMMRSALYTLNWIYIVLAHWNNSLRIDMLSHSRHIILIPSQPVFVLSPYNWPGKGSNLRSTTLEVNSLTITPPVPFRVNITFCFDPEVITCSTSLSSCCTDDSPILWTWWNNDIMLMRAAWVFFVFQLKNTDYADNCLPCFDKEDILGLG
jgi:hypothetical protein